MKWVRVLCMLGLIVGVFYLGFAEEIPRTATIRELKGIVEVRASKGGWMPAQVGMALEQRDIIRTQKASFALLNLNGMAETATVEIKEKSQLMLAELRADKKQGTQSTLLDLAVGEVLIRAQKLHSEKSRFEVKTPTSIVGVRGTTFSVTVEAIE